MKFSLYRILNIFIALVWLLNGFYAKILGKVPRHEQIITEILQTKNPEFFVILIGIAEIMMAVWILTCKYSKVNAILQSFVIILMNIFEFTFVPELLLWGRMNLIFSLLFVLLILWNEFYLSPHAKFKKTSIRG